MKKKKKRAKIIKKFQHEFIEDELKKKKKKNKYIYKINMDADYIDFGYIDCIDYIDLDYIVGLEVFD